MGETSLLLGAALALVCASSAVAIGLTRKLHTEGDQAGLFCALLGFAITAAAGASIALPGAQSALLWLSQAAQFLALPLIAAAALALSRSWTWSRPNWGRILLGLCAFFELFRQMHQLDNYRLLISVISLLLIVYAGAVQWPRRMPVLLGVASAGLLLLAGLSAANRLNPGLISANNLTLLLLTPASALLARLLVILPGQRKPE